VQRCTHLDQINDVRPSAQRCEECLEVGETWVHLRECLACGHVDCCDNSASHRVRNAGALLTFHATLSPAAPLPILHVTV
jgi:hypothetical protein